MLLTAVGRDANDQMYPLEWAVVEGENNDSWEWFMEELRKCLGINDGGEAWTFISDQQKGLLNAVALIWPRAEHRNCARHIYANWHKTFKDEELKELYWKATRAYCEPEYIQALDEMRSIKPDAVEALLKQDKTCFNRCYLKTHTKCDVIVNNMAETFNGYIINARSKHIIHMLEDIRIQIMSRLVTKKNRNGCQRCCHLP
ncbi:putative MULE transposase domain-containing protein [Helianthus annuus]|nr:putative MULE transposase domain-containing protein [Helianthus annuus]